MSDHKSAYLALGSNVGDKFLNITTAIKRMKSVSSLISIIKVSNVYSSQPVEMTIQEADSFLNVVCKIKTRLSPADLLGVTKTIEESLGRDARKFASDVLPRTIDIDLLFYGDSVIDNQNLQVPHPKIFERDFVFIPLGEVVDSSWKDPVEGLSYTQLLEKRYIVSRRQNSNIQRVLSLSLQEMICAN